MKHRGRTRIVLKDECLVKAAITVITNRKKIFSIDDAFELVKDYCGRESFAETFGRLYDRKNGLPLRRIKPGLYQYA